MMAPRYLRDFRYTEAVLKLAYEKMAHQEALRAFKAGEKWARNSDYLHGPSFYTESRVADMEWERLKFRRLRATLRHVHEAA